MLNFSQSSFHKVNYLVGKNWQECFYCLDIELMCYYRFEDNLVFYIKARLLSAFVLDTIDIQLNTFN